MRTALHCDVKVKGASLVHTEHLSTNRIRMYSNNLLPAWVQSWMFDTEEEGTSATPNSPYSSLSLHTGHLSTRVKITPPKLKLSHARESMQPTGRLTPMHPGLMPSSLMFDTQRPFSPVQNPLASLYK